MFSESVLMAWNFKIFLLLKNISGQTHKEMAPFNKCKVVLLLEFNWILYYVGHAVDTCKVTISQHPFKEVDYNVNTVNITCSFSASGCNGSPQMLWFRYRDFTHEALCTPKCIEKFEAIGSLSDNSALLQINKLTVNDSAIYICGIAFSNSNSHTSKQTGGGTILVKRGSEKYSTEEYITMTVLSSLLFLYSTTIFAIFIFYKSKSKLVKKTGKGDGKGEHHKNTSGRTVCRAIVQELYKKRYAQDHHQPECLEPDDTIYQNR
ncbi:immunoglobulin superfamily member 6 isoform X3 [Mauremys reevesii]|uniref:immunoglobulin superfamily member 6 isoform X3 n=1 Tax=Mauremys reevesii TaxID=260615 RepID=UPI001940083E|nr:immunoglobulin superfamily member 6 isoform X3 [Mauremys reevesii]